MLLQVMALAGDVADDFEAIGQTHFRNLAQRRVRLLRRRRIDPRADAALLRRRLKRRRGIARLERVPWFGNQLIDRRHRWPSLLSFPGKSGTRSSTLALCIVRTHRARIVWADRPGIARCLRAKTKSRHPPDCGRALFRSDDHVA